MDNNILPSEYKKKLNDAGLDLAEPYKGRTSEHHDLICLLCKSTFNATLKSKVQNHKKSGLRGCPKCTMDQRFAEEKESIRKKIQELGFEILTPFRNKNEYVMARNTNCNCGRSWRTKPTYILSGRSFCKPCNDESKAERMKQCNDDKHNMALSSMEGFKAYKKAVMVMSNRNFRENRGLIEKEHKRSKDYHLDHIVPISYCYKNEIPEEICAHVDNLRLIPASSNLRKNTKVPQVVPDVFKPYITSSNKIDDFMQELNRINSDFEFGAHLGGVDVTAHDPSRNIVFILIPLKENTQQTVGGRAGIKKKKDTLTNLGMRTFLFYEDEWDEKREIILSKVRYLYEGAKRIHARKCTIGNVDNDEKSSFLNTYHIQGNDRANEAYGLYYEGKLVALMSFSKPKIFMKGERHAGGAKNYELSRFCVKAGYSVVGGASKLLKAFTSSHEYDEIFSFSDRRVSDGNMYEQIGFTKEKVIDLDYAYVIDGKRKHRWDFRKDRIKEKYPHIYDASKTEYQMMLEMGVDRIWDAGKIRYIINKYQK